MPTVTNQTVIPDWLRPLFERQAGVGIGALDSLSGMLGGEDFGGVPAENLVAGFTPAQLEAFNLALARARGEGGFFPTAQNTILQAAQGQGLDSFVPQSALGALTGLTGAPTIAGTDVLGRVANSSAIDPQTLEVLRGTAGGDFLFGGQGFDQAVDAAIRAAQPSILSRFGSGGAGAGTGGLAQTAIAQAGIDAFAGQFGQERANQLNAAQQLSQLGLADRGQQLTAAQSLGQLDLSGRGQQLNAANILAGLGNDERSRQLTAAQLLPSIATADVDLLSRVGALQQDQAQRELSAPIQAMLQLLDASQTGGLSSLLGSSQNVPTDRNKLLEGLGIATSVGSLFGRGGIFGEEGAAERIGDLFGGGSPATPELASTVNSGIEQGILDTGATNAADLSNISQPTISNNAGLLDTGALGSTASLTPGLLNTLNTGINAGVTATEAANAAQLANLAQPTLAPISTSAGTGALGGGAAADAVGAGAGTAGGIAAGLGVAAIPALIMALGGFANDRGARNVQALQEAGIQGVTDPQGNQSFKLPDGTFIQGGKATMDAIRERWGVIPQADFWRWINSLPKVAGFRPAVPTQSIHSRVAQPRGSGHRSSN